MVEMPWQRLHVNGESAVTFLSVSSCYCFLALCSFHYIFFFCFLAWCCFIGHIYRLFVFSFPFSFLHIYNTKESSTGGPVRSIDDLQRTVFARGDATEHQDLEAIDAM